MALAIGYLRATPYRQAGTLRYQGGAQSLDIGNPDERQHANYVASMMEGRLPVFNPVDPNLYESYQSHQPPLYYALAAGWGKLVGVQSAEQGVALRGLNVLVGAVGVLGVFFACLWGYRSKVWALGAAALAALLPMNVALSASVSNDPLLFALIAWSLAMAFRAADHDWCVMESAVLGLLCGLAVLTKTTGVALLPVVAVAMLARPQKRPRFKSVLAFAAVFALLALPWWARNTSLYGDPLALKAFNQAFTGSAQAKDFIAALGASTYWLDWVGWWTARSFVGAFGYMDIFYPDALYRGLLALLAAMGIAGFVGLRRAARETDAADRYDKERTADPMPTLVMATLGAVVLMLFIRFNTQYFQGQARYLLPALPALAAWLTGGLKLLQPKAAVLAVGGMAVGLLGLNLWTLGFLASEFAQRVHG